MKAARLPPLPTYDEAARSCDANAAVASERAARCDFAQRYEGERAKADADGWRKSAAWYRAEIAARPELATMPIKMPGNFAPADAKAKAERHWTDREPGSDDE